MPQKSYKPNLKNFQSFYEESEVIELGYPIFIK